MPLSVKVNLDASFKNKLKRRRKPAPNPSQREGEVSFRVVRVFRGGPYAARKTIPRITQNTRTTRNVLNSTFEASPELLLWRTNGKMKSEGRTNPFGRVHFNGASVRSRDSTDCGQP